MGDHAIKCLIVQGSIVMCPDRSLTSFVVSGKRTFEQVREKQTDADLCTRRTLIFASPFLYGPEVLPRRICFAIPVRRTS